MVTSATVPPVSGSRRPGRALAHYTVRYRGRETRLTSFTTTQEVHLAAFIEILQSIRKSDMSPILSRLYTAQGGTEALDVLMKYMYVLAYSP